MRQWPGKTVIVGGGSAGLLSALTFAKAVPGSRVALVRSGRVPVIGVGESTTRAVPIFLHGTLGLDRQEFYRAVRPIWKLGNRLEWGAPEDSHFNYPFDSFLVSMDPSLRKPHLYYCVDSMKDAGRYSSLMDQARSPFFKTDDGRLSVEESFGYHIDNRRFLDFLEQQARESGVEFIEGDVVHVHRAPNGDVESLQLADDQRIEGDQFIDCSGFRSLLLKETFDQQYVSYEDALPCDSTVIGSWKRDDEVKPFTTVETMRHGWCWKIEFAEEITRGYVYSSTFCSEDEAIAELREKNPRIGDDIRAIKFPRGRYQNYWVNNVAAVGNSCGFLEPLEATSLQLVVEQLRYLGKAMLDSQGDPPELMRRFENERFRKRCDDTRDFLAVHYKFNRRIESPFWEHCREDTELGDAREIVDYYQQVGPSMLANQLVGEHSIFGYEGYLTILMGQRVPTENRPLLSDQERQAWKTYCDGIHQQASQALSMNDAMQIMFAEPPA